MKDNNCSVITFYNNKGGAGKTTSLITIAALLSDVYRKKVLVIDSDDQINTTNKLLALNENYQASLQLPDESQRNLKYAIESGNVEGCIYRTFFPLRNKITGHKLGEYYIDVIPGHPFLDATEHEKVDIISNLITPLRSQYDFILIDVHPSRVGMTMAAYYASDYIMIPAIPDQDHLEGAIKAVNLLELIKDSGYCENTKILGIFFTNWRKVVGLEKHIIETSTSDFQELFFEKPTRDASTILREAAWEGLPVNSYKATHPIVKEYRALIDEMLQRIKNFENEE